MKPLKTYTIPANTLAVGNVIRIKLFGLFRTESKMELQKAKQMKEFPKTFNDYAIRNNEMHPIAKLFYEAMLAVEKLGASQQQTDTVIKLGKCKDAVEEILFSNDAYKLGKVDGFLHGYEESHIDWDALKNDFDDRYGGIGQEIFNWIKTKLKNEFVHERQLNNYHVCVKDDKQPVLREYGTSLCSMCRPHDKSIDFQTTKENFDKLKYFLDARNSHTLIEVEAMAELFHNTYERLAPQFGYVTREDTKVFNKDSQNGKLMIAVCKEIFNEKK